jgi:5-methylcytosine-specific restriction endonuclease McrA
MTSVPKIPRARLDGDAYQQLRLHVLERDGWHCQSCGAMTNLQIHHARFRSHQGSDSEDNLITLCADCHKLIHTKS